MIALDSATPSQIDLANAAVEANLRNDGTPLYDSAQGYACALTAILQDIERLRSRPNGGAGDAIDYALGHITNPKAKLGFLDDWREGRDLDVRWRGYIRWLAIQRAGARGASGIETEGHDPIEGHGAEHESPTGKAGDAQPTGSK